MTDELREIQTLRVNCQSDVRNDSDHQFGALPRGDSRYVESRVNARRLGGVRLLNIGIDCWKHRFGLVSRRFA